MSAPPKVPRPSGTDELAVLRTAEAEASEIVNAARQERRARLKAAAVEAKAEIDEYRRQREERLAELGSEVRGRVRQRAAWLEGGGHRTFHGRGGSVEGPPALSPYSRHYRREISGEIL